MVSHNKPNNVDEDVASILIVDDLPNNLLAMEASLERLGVNMVRAYSGQEAIKKVSEHDFAVILMDVQMPVMDGLEAAERIRKLQGARATPIIFVTAGELTQDLVHRAYAEGAVDFLFKPYAPEIMRSKVQVFVDLYKYSQQLSHNVEELARAEEEVRQLNQALELRVQERTQALEIALEDAEASEQRYRQLAEALPQIVWMSDTEGTLLYCNSRFYEFTGLSPEDDPNEIWPSLIHPDDLSMLREKWTAALKTGEPLQVEYRLLRGRDKTWRYHMARAEAVRRSDGPIEKWLGIATEMEEKIRAELVLKEANLALAEARDRAVEASQAKSLFLANMSHELRTPLNAILGYAEMLEEELTESNIDLKDDADRIISAGKHLLSLIDDILDLAKIEAGKMKLSLDSVVIYPVVKEVSASLRGLAQQRNNTLQVSGEEFDLSAIVDPVKLRQILFNLVSNACKFTENGQIDVRLDNASRDDKPGFSIEVEDTGIGIAEDEARRLFKEFSQADPSASRVYGGTGLGLALSQRFAHMMGGMITLDSVEGLGSTFRLWLPKNSEDVNVE